MPDRRKTFSPPLEGGMIENQSPLIHGAQLSGSLFRAQNFEPSDEGGYRRIRGYEKYDTTAVPGTGKILGVFAFRNTVIACRGDGVYTSSGSGWTLIHTQTNTPQEYIATRYTWTEEVITLVDGANRPIRWNGTAVTVLNNAPEGATAVAAHRNHLWLISDSTVTYSAPNNDNDYVAANGAGVVQLGAVKNGLAPWRDNLYVFGQNTIDRIAGIPGEANFEIQPVTEGIGAVSGRAIVELSSDLYYVSFDGIRTISGTDRVGDTELGSVTRQIPETYRALEVTNNDADITAIVIPRLSQMRVFVGESTVPDERAKGLLGGIRLSSQGEIGLEWYRLEGINAACSDSDVFNNEELILFGDYSGFVYRLETGDSFDGDPINAFIRFPFWPFEDNERRKTLYKGRFYFQAEREISPFLNYEYDFGLVSTIRPPSILLGEEIEGISTYGTAIYGTSRYSSGFPTTAEVSLVGSGDNVSLTISSQDTLGQYTIQQITIEYELYGRR